MWHILSKFSSPVPGVPRAHPSSRALHALSCHCCSWQWHGTSVHLRGPSSRSQLQQIRAEPSLLPSGRRSGTQISACSCSPTAADDCRAACGIGTSPPDVVGISAATRSSPFSTACGFAASLETTSTSSLVCSAREAAAACRTGFVSACGTDTSATGHARVSAAGNASRDAAACSADMPGVCNTRLSAARRREATAACSFGTYVMLRPSDASGRNSHVSSAHSRVAAAPCRPGIDAASAASVCAAEQPKSSTGCDCTPSAPCNSSRSATGSTRVAPMCSTTATPARAGDSLGARPPPVSEGGISHTFAPSLPELLSAAAACESDKLPPAVPRVCLPAAVLYPRPHRRHSNPAAGTTSGTLDAQQRSAPARDKLPAAAPEEKGVQEILVDRFGRKHTYLRISLTEACNLSCTYCRPRRPHHVAPRLSSSDEEPSGSSRSTSSSNSGSRSSNGGSGSSSNGSRNTENARSKSSTERNSTGEGANLGIAASGSHINVRSSSDSTLQRNSSGSDSSSSCCGTPPNRGSNATRRNSSSSAASRSSTAAGRSSSEDAFCSVNDEAFSISSSSSRISRRSTTSGSCSSREGQRTSAAAREVKVAHISPFFSPPALHQASLHSDARPAAARDSSRCSCSQQHAAVLRCHSAVTRAAAPAEAEGILGPAIDAAAALASAAATAAIPSSVTTAAASAAVTPAAARAPAAATAAASETAATRAPDAGALRAPLAAIATATAAGSSGRAAPAAVDTDATAEARDVSASRAAATGLDEDAAPGAGSAVTAAPPVASAAGGRDGNAEISAATVTGSSSSSTSSTCRPCGGCTVPTELTSEQIVAIASAFLSCGGKKIRLTGGEPTMRRDFSDLLQQIGELSGLETLAVTTNGIRLLRLCDAFKRAGVNAVNISLDTLRKERYQMLTGVSGFATVWKGLMHLIAADMCLVKINVVLLRGFNDDEIVDFVKLTQDLPVHVRFIEFMPFKGNSWEKKLVVGKEEIVSVIRHCYPQLRQLPETFSRTKEAAVAGAEEAAAAEETAAAAQGSAAAAGEGRAAEAGERRAAAERRTAPERRRAAEGRPAANGSAGGGEVAAGPAGITAAEEEEVGAFVGANETASLYYVPGYKGCIGIVAAVTDLFCSSCNRLRVTADGKVKNCLFSREEFDVLPSLSAAAAGGPHLPKRQQKTQQQQLVEEVFRRAVLAKQAVQGGCSDIAKEAHLNRPMIRIGG